MTIRNNRAQVIMVYAAIGGMQLQHWTAYFRIIWPTVRVLLQARKTKGCVWADMFKDGDVYFAVSVWENEEAMKEFANTGLHHNLRSMAMETMAMFHNHTQECVELPSREECVAFWKHAMKSRAGRGSVGVYEQ